MKTLRRMLGTALVAVTAVSLTAMEPANASTGGDELSFVAKLNDMRVAQGLRPLETRGALFDMARSWSGHMLAAGGISHNPNMAAQAPGNWAKLGENVGMGMDVQGLHDAFVASPSHYRNMVDGQFDAVGVGVVHRGDGMIFVTVNFMTTKAAPAVAAPAAAPAAAKAQARKACSKTRRGKVVCRVVRARR